MTHMRTTLQRRIAATTAALTMTALVAACGGGTTTGSSSAAKDVSEVKDDQLKGVTIQLARFFGDCTDTVGKKTDISKVVGECETIQTLTNKFNTENRYGIKVERLGGAAWESYYDQLNATFAGGKPPDVAIMHGSSLVDYAKRGLLMPMDDLAKVTHT